MGRKALSGGGEAVVTFKGEFTGSGNLPDQTGRTHASAFKNKEQPVDYIQ